MTILLLLSSAMAAVLPEKPPEIATIIHAETPYGKGVLSRVWIKVYDASLWTDATTWSMEKPFALTVRYAIGFDVNDLVNRTIEEMQHVDDVPNSDLSAYAQKLTAIYPKVHSGDTITALFVPPRETQFFHNGKPIGNVSDAKFSQRFFAIWLSPKTSEPQLRAALLNRHDGD